MEGGILGAMAERYASDRFATAQMIYSPVSRPSALDMGRVLDVGLVVMHVGRWVVYNRYLRT